MRGDRFLTPVSIAVLAALVLTVAIYIWSPATFPDSRLVFGGGLEMIALLAYAAIRAVRHDMKTQRVLQAVTRLAVGRDRQKMPGESRVVQTGGAGGGVVQQLPEHQGQQHRHAVCVVGEREAVPGWRHAVLPASGFVPRDGVEDGL